MSMINEMNIVTCEAMTQQFLFSIWNDVKIDKAHGIEHVINYY